MSDKRVVDIEHGHDWYTVEADDKRVRFALAGRDTFLVTSSIDVKDAFAFADALCEVASFIEGATVGHAEMFNTLRQMASATSMLHPSQEVAAVPSEFFEECAREFVRMHSLIGLIASQGPGHSDLAGRAKEVLRGS